VVLLTPEGQLPELGQIKPNTPIKMGEKLACFTDNKINQESLTEDQQ